MTVDENLRQTFEAKYDMLSKLEMRLHGHSNSYLLSVVIGVIILPAMNLSGGDGYIFLFIFWSFWLYLVYTTITDIPKKNKVLAELRELEAKLAEVSTLKFCACNRYAAHFFSPETEQLYNLKSDVLFEKHPITNYETWYSLYKPEPKWRRDLYAYTMVVFLILNIVLTF